MWQADCGLVPSHPFGQLRDPCEDVGQLPGVGRAETVQDRGDSPIAGGAHALETCSTIGQHGDHRLTAVVGSTPRETHPSSTRWSTWRDAALIEVPAASATSVILRAPRSTATSSSASIADSSASVATWSPASIIAAIPSIIMWHSVPSIRERDQHAADRRRRRRWCHRPPFGGERQMHGGHSTFSRRSAVCAPSAHSMCHATIAFDNWHSVPSGCAAMALSAIRLPPERH